MLAEQIRSRIAGDSWYTLLSGRLIVRSGLPTRNTLTVVAAGHRWVDQQWLAQLGFYGLWRLGGLALTLLGVELLYVAAFALLAASARRLGASDRSVALVVAVCFLVGFGNTVLRAQTLGYLLFALVLALLLADERRPSWRVALVFPVLVLWANVHGSVLLGAGLVSLRGLTLAAASLRRSKNPSAWAARAGVLLLVPWLCVLASPYAFQLPGYYREFTANSTFASFVPEWAPTDVHNQPFFFILLFIGLWLVFRAASGLSPFARLAFLAMAVGGLLAARNVVWCALLAAAVLPAGLDALWPPTGAPRRRGPNLAIAGLGVLVGTIAAASILVHSDSFFERSYPAEAEAAVATALRLNPGARVFAEVNSADWLLFEQPALSGRVALDVRLELLSGAEIDSIADFYAAAGPDWQRAAAGYGILVLNPVGEQAAIALLERSPGTRVLYAGPALVVLGRTVALPT